MSPRRYHFLYKVQSKPILQKSIAKKFWELQITSQLYCSLEKFS